MLEFVHVCEYMFRASRLRVRDSTTCEVIVKSLFIDGVEHRLYSERKCYLAVNDAITPSSGEGFVTCRAGQNIVITVELFGVGDWSVVLEGIAVEWKDRDHDMIRSVL